MVRDGVHIAAGLRESDAGLEAADGVSAFVDPAIAERRIVPLAQRNIDVAVRAVEEEVRRKNADDGVVRTVERDHVAED